MSLFAPAGSATNKSPKSLHELMDICALSRSAMEPLLLNIPPNQDGKFADADGPLKEFKSDLGLTLRSVNCTGRSFGKN